MFSLLLLIICYERSDQFHVCMILETCCTSVITSISQANNESKEKIRCLIITSNLFASSLFL